MTPFFTALSPLRSRLRPLVFPLVLSFGLLAVSFAAQSDARSETQADAAPLPQAALKISYSIAALPALEPAAEYDLWSRIRTGFKLPESDPALTRAHERAFSKNAAFMEQIADRSKPYLFYIVDEVERRGMPMEIALLPIIESAFNPQALSPMQAAGIWQFIPSTGKVYGLQQNAWYDGRRDILQATHAALDYLQKLHSMFGDWELALAAYNCGEGCVARAQSRGAGNQYSTIKLPKETRNYVPKLIAVRNIIRNPENFSVNLDRIPNEPYFLQVNLKHPMEARQAARMAEMDLEDFLKLNPAFQRRVIHTATQSVLLLPTDKVEVFQFNLNKKGGQYRLQNYTARQGENASNIAKEFGVTLAWLKENNPLKLYQGKVAKSQTLIVPMAKERVVREGTSPSKVSAAKASVKTVTRTHKIRKGDTLARVAKLYNVKIADIREWNAHAEPLRLGAKLTIPQPS